MSINTVIPGSTRYPVEKAAKGGHHSTATRQRSFRASFRISYIPLGHKSGEASALISTKPRHVFEQLSRASAVKHSRLLQCLALIATLALSGRAMANTPTETVARTVDSVIAVLQDTAMNSETKKRQVKGIISRNFDFRAMASRVLATNWKKATKKQRIRFTSLFKELLSNTYWRKISGYQDETVEYTGEKLRNNDLATVNTLIRTASLDIPVDYKLYRKEDGWYAYDVVIEQVSLVRNYRGSFQKIVHDVGIDGLIQQLETKVARSSLPEEEP